MARKNHPAAHSSNVNQNQWLSIFRDRPDGLSRAEIVGLLSEPVAVRTLIRRLQELVRSGLLQVSGVGRGTRYHSTSPATSTLAQDKSVIPLSASGNAVRKAISRPREQRLPVAYSRDFLDRYQPNMTYYLTRPQRQHLHETGSRIPIVQRAGTYAKHVMQRLLIDLSWNSSRLEGNTYSLLDTEKLLQEGTAALGKSALEAQMILNHKEAIEFLVRSTEETGFNRYTISNLHALLSHNLLSDPAAPGRLRFQPVGILHSVYMPSAIPQLIEELFTVVLEKASAIADPFEQALFVMVHLPYLQPFDDVNKRVSRLAANIPFIRDNLAPLSFTEVPHDLYIHGLLGVYEMNRTELLRDVFCWAYERSAAQYAVIPQTIGEPDPFRLRYRELISELVSQIVSEDMPRPVAEAVILRRSQPIPSEDARQLRETVMTELDSLHEGSVARYRIGLAAFQTWKQQWAT